MSKSVPVMELLKALESALSKPKANKSGSGLALRDKVNLTVSGHLKFELYNENGEVIKTIEQDNMVTENAFAILTRLVASDTDAGTLTPVLRTVPSKDGVFDWVFMYESDIRTIYRHELRGRRYTSDPWTTVDVWYDYNRDVSGRSTSYRYTSEVVTEIARSISLGDYRIGYIAIGDGKDYLIPASDSKFFKFDGNWSLREQEGTVASVIRETADPNATLTITFRGTRLVGYFSLLPNGADISVSVNGGSQVTRSLYSGSPARSSPIVLADGLPEGEHTVVIRHLGTGFDEQAESYVLAFEGARANGLYKSINSMFREIAAAETKIEVPEIYNTTNNPPYTFTLKRGQYKIVPGSEAVVHDGKTFRRTELAPTAPDEYYIDYLTGQLRFALPLSGVQVTYQTQEPFETNYRRAEVQRPKSGPNYPWYNEKTAVVYLTADFPPGVPNYPVAIREVALFDYPVDVPIAKMFSIVRPPEIHKDEDTGIRITWEIRLKEDA